MSNDVGICILMTGRSRGLSEYRVARCEDVEGLLYTCRFNGDRIPQDIFNALVSCFDASRVFYDKKFAEGYAIARQEDLIKELGPGDYQIILLRHPSIRFPKNTASKPNNARG